MGKASAAITGSTPSGTGSVGSRRALEETGDWLLADHGQEGYEEMKSNKTTISKSNVISSQSEAKIEDSPERVVSVLAELDCRWEALRGILEEKAKVHDQLLAAFKDLASSIDDLAEMLLNNGPLGEGGREDVAYG